MKIIFVSLTAFFIIACTGSKCVTADKVFVNNFNSKLGVIKDFEDGTISINDDEYRMTLIYLGKITGISSRAEYSSTMGYRNKKYYTEDVKKWKKWLSNNRCWYNTKIADSVLKIKH